MAADGCKALGHKTFLWKQNHHLKSNSNSNIMPFTQTRFRKWALLISPKSVLQIQGFIASFEKKKQLFTQAFPFPIQVALRTCQPLPQAPWRVLPGARHARDSACSKKSGLFRMTASQKSPSMDKSTQLKADVKHGMLNHNLSTWKVLLKQTIPLGGSQRHLWEESAIFCWSTKSSQILPSVWVKPLINLGTGNLDPPSSAKIDMIEIQ